MSASPKALASQWVLGRTEKGEIAGTVKSAHIRDAFSEQIPALPAPELITGGLSALLNEVAFGVQDSRLHGISPNQTNGIKFLVDGLPERIQSETPNSGRNPGGIRDLLFKLGMQPVDAAKDGKPAGAGLAETATGGSPQGGLKNPLLRLDLDPEASGKMSTSVRDSVSMLPEASEMRSTLHDGIKKVLFQLGLSSQEVEEIAGRDKPAFARLSELFFKSGNPAGLDPSPVAETGMARDLKTFLLTRGITPGYPENMFEAGEYGNKPLSSREWMTLLPHEADHRSDGTIPSVTGKEGHHAGAKEAGDTRNGQECMVSFLAGGQPAAEEKASAGCEQLPSMKGHDGVTQKVVEQVVRGIRIQLEHGQAEARISLDPPSLGKVHMHIVTRENQVSATFFAETPHVKEIIESNFPQLRESFLEQGMKVEHFSVFVGNQPSGNQAGGYTPSTAGISYHGLREIPEGEDILAPEHVAGRAARDHMIDLFI